MSAIEIGTIALSGLGLVVACFSPCLTALTNLIMFGGFRALKVYLAPPAPAAAISTNSTLVCSFQPPDV